MLQYTTVARRPRADVPTAPASPADPPADSLAGPPAEPPSEPHHPFVTTRTTKTVADDSSYDTDDLYGDDCDGGEVTTTVETRADAEDTAIMVEIANTKCELKNTNRDVVDI